ncbi:MAG TPA: M20/M25/M40 family metallo-hydrolase [bacterium]|jgi:hypothetical protein
MRQSLLLFCLTLFVSTAWSKPALLIIDRKDVPVAKVQVLRELKDQVFVAAEVSDLSTANIPFTLIDADYSADHYLVISVLQAREQGLSALWQDEKRALVKFDAPVMEWEGPHQRLEQGAIITRESRPPSHLDDPALDAWLSQLAAQTNADTLLSFVTTLASYNRYARYTSNDNAATWIRSKFLSYGYDSVYYHAFTAHASGWSRTANNVIAVLPGTASPDSIVIIGGHFDATSESPSSAAPGADDNGTGTAGMLEAARLLANQSFTHTVMFVAFNAEEQGLQGSAALASLMASQGRRVIGLVNMDMIGYYDPAGADLWIEGFHTGTNSLWLENALRDNCLQFSSLVPYLYPDDGWGSDHESFHAAGFNAVLAIENEYETYPCYHRTCDLPSQVTASFMRNMASVVIVTGAELALPHGTGSISGQVTLQGSSNAAGVAASIAGGGAADTTDAAGAYVLSGLLPGTYSVAFARTGFVSDTLHGIVVLSDQQTANQNITLTATLPGSVSGTITLSGGSGVLTQTIVYVDDALAAVNSSGQYTLAPVYSGQKVITASLNGYAIGSQIVTLSDGQQMSNVNITLYPLWDLEASNYGLDNHSTGWGWGTDAITGAHSGTHVWGTVLGGSYANCTDYTLDMPAVSLAHLDSARLTFYHWYNIEPNGATQAYDGANVSVAPLGSSTWTVLQPVGGYPGNAGGTCNPIQGQAAYDSISPGWVPASFNLNAYLGQTIRVRFRLGSDQGVTRRGWYLDDLALLGYHTVQVQPPTRVQDLTVYPVEGGLYVQWSATSGALRYKIYRGTSFEQPVSGMTLLSTQTGTSFTDTAGPELLKAFYVVIAEN